MNDVARVRKNAPRDTNVWHGFAPGRWLSEICAQSEAI